MKKELVEEKGSKQIRVSMAVWNHIIANAKPFETADSILRRVLSLPERKKGVSNESPKSKPRRSKKAT